MIAWTPPPNSRPLKRQDPLPNGIPYSINGWPTAVNIGEAVLGNIRQPLLWLVSGVLVGIGFVSAFSGGLLLLLAGLAIAVTLFVRNRARRRGWPALLYGAGITTALLLLPYLVGPSPCVSGAGAGCYEAFTVGTFAVAMLLALTGLAFAVVEVRGARRP
jgi:hypothetical protein